MRLARRSRAAATAVAQAAEPQALVSPAPRSQVRIVMWSRSTTWASVTRTGQLRIGVRYLPGTVRAIGLRTADASMAAADKSAPGFLLQAIPALKTPPSLIIPRNWFQPGRVLEITQQSAEKLNAKMGFSVERGIDYERVSFTLV